MATLVSFSKFPFYHHTNIISSSGDIGLIGLAVMVLLSLPPSSSDRSNSDVGPKSYS